MMMIYMQLYEFDQTEFFYASPPALSSMDEVGYIYVPSGCKSGLRSIYYVLLCFYCAFSALTLLVGRQEWIRPVKTEW